MTTKNTITAEQVSQSLNGLEVKTERSKNTFSVIARYGNSGFMTLQQLKDLVKAQDYFIINTADTEIWKSVIFKV